MEILRTNNPFLLAIGAYAFTLALGFGLIAFVILIYCFIQLDISYFVDAIPIFSPEHMWVRIAILVHIGLSLLYGRIVSEIG